MTFLSNRCRIRSLLYGRSECLPRTSPKRRILRALLGTITLNAPNALTLAPGSLTSVSLDGLIVPYGAVSMESFSGDATQLYDSGAVPVKAISLNGKTVTVTKRRGGGCGPTTATCTRDEFWFLA